jgi:hypothetical protein
MFHPDFLQAAPDTTACAAFIKESRMNFTKANQLYRKSGSSILYKVEDLRALPPAERLERRGHSL